MRYKVIEHKSGIEQIVNPIAVRARGLREKAFVFDTETTGSSKVDEVIDLGVVRASSGDVLVDQLFRPSKKIDPWAFQVHGITDEELLDKPRIAERWDELYPLLDGATCVAWNSSYDSRLFSQTADKYGLPLPRIEWVCAMKLYREFKGLPKNPKLEDACRALGVRGGTHRAAPDALAAARVLYRIAGAAPEDEVITFDHARQADEDDGKTMRARDFLTQFTWRESKAPAGAGIVSKWIDPTSGQMCGFLRAMDRQRERMNDCRYEKPILDPEPEPGSPLS